MIESITDRFAALKDVDVEVYQSLLAVAVRDTKPNIYGDTDATSRIISVVAKNNYLMLVDSGFLADGVESRDVFGMQSPF